MERDFIKFRLFKFLTVLKRKKYNKTGGNTAKNTRQKIVTGG